MPQSVQRLDLEKSFDLIMSQAITKNINLQQTIDTAIQETQEMMQQEIDISDPSVVTPLESIANQYPEISPQCNQLLMELVQQQIKQLSGQESPQLTNEF